jgi:ketosteroid isomerase-like protein
MHHSLRCLRAVAILGLLTLSCVSRALGETGKESSLKDNQEIRKTVEALNTASTHRDVAATMALFDDTDDVMLVGSDVGEVFKGREILSARLKEIYALPFVLSFDMPNVTVHVEARTAWIFGEGAAIIDEGAGKISRTPYRFTIFLVKRGEGWKWQVFSGSVPRPAAP